MTILLLSGCTALDVLSSVMGGGNSGVSVPIDAQIGRENTKQVVGQQVTVTGDQTNSKIDVEEAKEVTINESPSFWFMVLFALGWLLPSPKDILSAFVSSVGKLIGGKSQP